MAILNFFDIDLFVCLFFEEKQLLLHLQDIFIFFSNGLPPQPVAPAPVYSYLGKRQITAIRVTPAPTTPPKPKPSGGATAKPTPGKPTPPKVPTTK